MTITKTEWEALKNRYGNKCLMCGTPDRGGRLLEKAHLKAKSKGGTQYVPLCPTCHTNFDKGLATDAELKKLGLSRAVYGRVQPKKSSTKKESASPESPFTLGFKPIELNPLASPFSASPAKSKSTKSKKESASSASPFALDFKPIELKPLESPFSASPAKSKSAKSKNQAKEPKSPFDFSRL